MTAFQASGTDSLYLDQYFNTFWFLISKFLSLSGGAWVPKVPIATTPMTEGPQLTMCEPAQQTIYVFQLLHHMMDGVQHMMDRGTSYDG